MVAIRLSRSRCRRTVNFGDVLDVIAIVPSAPVLLPELSGAAAVELAELRDAVFTAAAALPARWIMIGSGSVDAEFGPGCLGTFAGFGVDLVVRLSPDADEPADLPLCALMAGWIRGRVRPDACIQAYICADPDAGPALGARLRAHIDQTPEHVGVLVVADGANTLTPAAPGGYCDADLGVQAVLDEALSHGDGAALTRLPASVVGRAGYAVLAGLAGAAAPAPMSASALYRGAPYGVGYFTGIWQP